MKNETEVNEMPVIVISRAITRVSLFVTVKNWSEVKAQLSMSKFDREIARYDECAE